MGIFVCVVYSYVICLLLQSILGSGQKATGQKGTSVSKLFALYCVAFSVVSADCTGPHS